MSRTSAGVWLGMGAGFPWPCLESRHSAGDIQLVSDCHRNALKESGSEAVWVYKFPFSGDSIYNEHFCIIPAAALGTPQWLGGWMKEGASL